MNQSQRYEPSSLTTKQIAQVEEHLEAKNFPNNPNEIEIAIMAQTIATQLNDQINVVELIVYLKHRGERKNQETIIPTTKQQNFDVKSTSIFKQFAEPIKHQEPPKPRAKEYVCKSKRKIRPTEPIEEMKSLQDFVQILDGKTNDCNIIMERKNRKTLSQRELSGPLHSICQWTYNEHFYCNYDRSYFKQQEPLKRLIIELKLNPERMTYFDHRMIRLALPMPRLFNQQFIASQIDKLNDYRNLVRSYPKQRTRGELQLSVGKEVIAVHPVCGHLHSGSILAIYKENQYMVKFIRPQLGTQKVLDINMTLKEVSNPYRVVVENIDFQVMALAIKLLEYKSDLIKLLREYNNLAENIQKQKGVLDNKFFQQYGWIGSTINILTLGLKHIISKFRVRGVTSANQQKVGRHFATILLNPLNLMQKQLDKSFQNSDANASNQIKRIISSYKETKTETYSKALFAKYWPTIKEQDWKPQQKQEMEKLLKSLVGLLVNLKVESRNFAIDDNKYLSELMGQIDNKFPEHVNQIYETLHSITAKLNEQAK